MYGNYHHPQVQPHGDERVAPITPLAAGLLGAGLGFLGGQIVPSPIYYGPPPGYYPPYSYPVPGPFPPGYGYGPPYYW